MHQAGFKPSIAFNEHRAAPALSALAKLDPEDFDKARRQSRNAARNRRRNLARAKGPAQAVPHVRMRTRIRVLVRTGNKARKRGDLHAAQQVAIELGRIFKARAGVK